MRAERLTLFFCAVTLVVAAASTVLHFPAVWIALPAAGAILCALLTPVRSMLEIFFGGRR